MYSQRLDEINSLEQYKKFQINSSKSNDKRLHWKWSFFNPLCPRNDRGRGQINEARTSSRPRSRKNIYPTLGLVLGLKKLRIRTSVLASSLSGGPSRTSDTSFRRVLEVRQTAVGLVKQLSNKNVMLIFYFFYDVLDVIETSSLQFQKRYGL